MFIKSQRAKTGEKGRMQIANPDFNEDARQKSYAARKDKERIKDESGSLVEDPCGRMQIANPDFNEDARQRSYAARKDKDYNNNNLALTKQKIKELELQERIKDERGSLVEDPCVEVDEYGDKILIKTKRNMIDLSSTAKTSMRYELSVRSTAAVTSAYLGDLIRAGEISPIKAYLAVGPRNLHRARDRVLGEAVEKP